MKRLAMLGLLLPLLGACTANTYAHKNFDVVDAVTYRDADLKMDFSIRDKPTESRLKMLLGLGGSVNLLLWGGNAVPPLPLYEQAAIRFLATQGRTCTVVRSFEIIKSEVEVDYNCTP